MDRRDSWLTLSGRGVDPRTNDTISSNPLRTDEALIVESTGSRHRTRYPRSGGAW